MKVLILCTGNSCRSQMAHGFLQSFDSRIAVYSGGTKPSKQINSTAIKVMQEAGIDISGHTQNLVDKYTNIEWEYVITVCSDAEENCPVFTGNVKNKLHIGFDDPSYAEGTEEHIMSEFYRVREEIRQAFYKLYTEEIKPQL